MAKYYACLHKHNRNKLKIWYAPPNFEEMFEYVRDILK